MELFYFGILVGAVCCLIAVIATIIFRDREERDVEETEAEFICTELNNLKTILGLSRGDREIIDKAISYIEKKGKHNG